MSWNRCAMLAILAILPGLARAETLTWTDCLREAVSNNPDLVAAREAIRAAEASLKATGSEKRPQLSASANLGASGGDNVEDEPAESSDAGLSASQLLYSGGRVSSAIDRSEATLAETRAVFAQTAATVSFDLKTAYARLLYAQALVTLTELIAQRRQDNLDLVELRYEGGREHKGSYLRSKAALTQARFEAAQAGRSEAVARRFLARVLGRTSAEGLSVAGPFEPAAPETGPDFNALAAVSPLRDQSEARRRFAEADLRNARSAYYPDLSLVGSIARSSDSYFPEDDGWFVGLSVDIPIYPGGRTGHEVDAARAALRRAEAQLRISEGDVLTDLVAAHASLLDGVEQIDVQAEFLEAARVRAEIARSQYTSGLMTFDDWDLIETDRINAEKSLLGTKRDAVLAEAAWELAKGDVLFRED